MERRKDKKWDKNELAKQEIKRKIRQRTTALPRYLLGRERDGTKSVVQVERRQMKECKC